MWSPVEEAGDVVAAGAQSVTQQRWCVNKKIELMSDFIAGH
jgi:hypothetical protein